MLWPHKNSFRAVLHIVSLSCSLSCLLYPLVLSVAASFVQKVLSCFLLSLSRQKRGKKKVCLNRFQVMFKDSSPHPLSFTPLIKQYLCTCTTRTQKICACFPCTCKLHLSAFGAWSSCHLFKCALIVWPWGLAGWEREVRGGSTDTQNC